MWDTDFIQQVQYALGHDSILYVTQSKSEVQDTVPAVLHLAGQYPTLVNLRFTIQVGGQIQRIP